jgi:hypothetical protein
MMKIRDSEGREVRGHFRDHNGSIIVDDPTRLNKYSIERQKDKEFRELIELRSKVEELSSMMVQIKEMMERNNNG